MTENQIAKAYLEGKTCFTCFHYHDEVFSGVGACSEGADVIGEFAPIPDSSTCSGWLPCSRISMFHDMRYYRPKGVPFK